MPAAWSLFCVDLYLFGGTDFRGPRKIFDLCREGDRGSDKALAGCGRPDRQGDHEFQDRTENGLRPHRYPNPGEMVKVEYQTQKGVPVAFTVTILEGTKEGSKEGQKEPSKDTKEGTK